MWCGSAESRIMARFLRSIGRSSTYTRDFANYAARAFHMPMRQSSQPCRKGRPVNYVTDPLSQKIIKVIGHEGSTFAIIRLAASNYFELPLGFGHTPVHRHRPMPEVCVPSTTYNETEHALSKMRI